MKSFLYAADEPGASGIIRQTPEDFVVEENLGFEADGEGEHVLLHIRKKELTTFQLIRALSQRTGVKERDIGFCGLKDKNAVTEQSLSLFLRKECEPAWDEMNIPGVAILDAQRHRKKLRRGIHRGNRFRILVRSLEGDVQELPEKLDFIRERGAPNYFGEQRFGRDNLEKAGKMFSGAIDVRKRQQRSLYLSSARSWLFNRILSERIALDCWDTCLDGDVLQHDGKKSCFLAESPQQEMARVKNAEIHPTGALYGAGDLPVSGKARMLEQSIFSDEALFCDGLAEAGLKQERRSLRLIARDLEWSLDTKAATLELKFSLNRGEFATSLLRELLTYVD